ncbi:hypothetical protein ABT127_25780 [Streptomyces sp. NPDC001904]|uniref:hypothetical protein n=1 Tax=Streptomyces sp. NPDC001904 TaxID=3154531 RepID=UPI003328480C
MTSPSADTLRSRYVEQAASDLEDNRRRQQELTEKIRMLEQEEALLVDIMQLAERHEGAEPPSPSPARTPAPAKEKAAQPLLGDLLAGLLAPHKEPRLAKELRDELLEKHPDRSPTPQVVRNTLESLVARGRIQRHKQQRSVMYTNAESDPADTDG